jgi:hypothetical protein
MTDHDNSHLSIREIKISCGLRPENGNDWMAKGLEYIVTGCQEARTKFDLHDRCHRFSECVPL